MFYLLLAYITWPFVRLMAGRPSDAVVVFQTAKIGDMVSTTPVFREIKRKRPRARLAVVTSPVAAPLLSYNPHVDEVIIWRERGGLLNKVAFSRKLRKKRFGAAVILAPNAPNILAAFWAAIRVRIAVRPDYSGFTLRRLLALNTHVEPHRHGRMTLETYLESLRPLGVTDYSIRKEVYRRPGVKVGELLSGPGPFIGMVPGTANSLKDWGVERFGRLAALIIEKTPARLVLLGSEADAGRTRIIREVAGGGERIIDLAGRLGLNELPSVMEEMSLVIGVDTGPLYIADALGVPALVIAGPADMEDQRPTGPQAVIIRKEVDCAPCAHTFSTPYGCTRGRRECLERVSPEEVFGAVEKFLRRRESGHVGAGKI